MQVHLTLQERLADLRNERGLTLSELAEKTQIPTATLSTYENNDTKEIYHGNLVILADFYGVSLDYLLGRTDIRRHEDTPIMDLDLTDDAVDVLKSGRINNRLLCEIITNEKFEELMADTEIYVDGIATVMFNDIDLALEHVRSMIIEETPEAAEDRTLRTLEAAQIKEEDFFCDVTHKNWDQILHDIRKNHEDNNEIAGDETPAQKALNALMAEVKTIVKAYRDPVPPFTDLFCELFNVKDKIDEEEKRTLEKVFRKSELLQQYNKKGKKKRRKY